MPCKLEYCKNNLRRKENLQHMFTYSNLFIILKLSTFVASWSQIDWNESFSFSQIFEETMINQHFWWQFSWFLNRKPKDIDRYF